MRVVFQPVRYGFWFVSIPLLLSFDLFAANDTGFQKNGALFFNEDVPAERIIGVDHHGVPLLCNEYNADATATGAQVTPAAKPPPPPPPTVLPSGMRSWECVPSVIRNNGVDSFRVEVDANGVVSDVVLSVTAEYLSFVSGTNTQHLRDDGLNGDRVASDRIFTSERIIYNGAYPIPNNYGYDTNSPAGLHFQYLGFLYVVETNGVTNQFLLAPSIGLLSTNVPLVETCQLASNIVVSPHLVNISTGTRQTQKTLRAGTMSALNSVTLPIYSILPDAFDFLVFFSVDRAEYFPYIQYSANGIAGVHQTVQVKYSGTGLITNNSSAYFGSAGHLLGINILDAADRGISDWICTHELLHQWVSFTSGSLGLTSSDGSHYSSACSAKSLVGGSAWTSNLDGTFIKDCGFDTAAAPPLDKYMMGLIAGSNVPPLYVNNDGPGCYAVVTNYRTVTISDIQAVHGVRMPDPTTAQKNFSLCFVAESFGRLLNPVEMTFFDTLAGHYTKPVPAGVPPPALNGAWSSIAGYFGEGSQWHSDALDVIRPKITLVERPTNGSARVSGTGYPGKNYRLLGSTNFQTWSSLTNKIADTNGAFVLQDTAALSNQCRFYRVVTP